LRNKRVAGRYYLGEIMLCNGIYFAFSPEIVHKEARMHTEWGVKSTLYISGLKALGVHVSFGTHF
jgi:hypothetical protein